ncbi:hypothetical protein PFAG_05227 [Plasmodium falciparum Santa Lucia]|uniref:Uncharacterized protein n=3 Tax=Plasmodium falciparum TaxID=5833 RepID=A0A024V127_PLAFA|nr:hypothetical protein PFFVO_04776 [Plasmodium falciparum Vietnam Oak-Knoll (FVO)]ETW40317.1 hypothetical protein PFNF135_05359 [Plasmodium falciparum NF135/5.C10]EUT78652.1 hypothetical protein PFAG_05227 [Plasmodium falciparum Santa Lucia]
MVYKNFDDEVGKRKIFLNNRNCEDYSINEGIKIKMEDWRSENKYNNMHNDKYKHDRDILNKYSYQIDNVKKKDEREYGNYKMNDYDRRGTNLYGVTKDYDDNMEIYRERCETKMNETYTKPTDEYIEGSKRRISQRDIKELLNKYNKKDEYYHENKYITNDKRHTYHNFNRKYDSLNQTNNSMLDSENKRRNNYSHDDLTRDKIRYHSKNSRHYNLDKSQNSVNMNYINNNDINNLKIFNRKEKDKGRYNRINENVEYCKKNFNNINLHNEVSSTFDSDEYEKYNIRNHERKLSPKKKNQYINYHNNDNNIFENSISPLRRYASLNKSMGYKNSFNDNLNTPCYNKEYENNKRKTELKDYEHNKLNDTYERDKKKSLYDTFFNITEKLESIKKGKEQNGSLQKNEDKEIFQEEEKNEYYSNENNNNTIKKKCNLLYHKNDILHDMPNYENMHNSYIYNNRDSFRNKEDKEQNDNNYQEEAPFDFFIKKYPSMSKKNNIKRNDINVENIYKGVTCFDDILKYNSEDSITCEDDKHILKNLNNNINNNINKNISSHINSNINKNINSNINKKDTNENYQEKIQENLPMDEEFTNIKKPNANLDDTSLSSNNLKSTQLHMSAISHGSNDYSTLYDYTNYSKHPTKESYSDENLYNVSKYEQYMLDKKLNKSSMEEKKKKQYEYNLFQSMPTRNCRNEISYNNNNNMNDYYKINKTYNIYDMDNMNEYHNFYKDKHLRNKNELVDLSKLKYDIDRDIFLQQHNEVLQSNIFKNKDMDENINSDNNNNNNIKLSTSRFGKINKSNDNYIMNDTNLFSDNQRYFTNNNPYVNNYYYKNNNHNGDDKNLHMMNKLKYFDQEHFINEVNPKYFNSNINKINHYNYNGKNNNKNNINQYENENDNINIYNKKYNSLPYEEDEKYTSNITNMVENDSDYIIKNIGKKYILNEDSDQLNKLLELRKNNKKKKMRIQNNQKYSYQDHFYFDDEVNDKYISKTLNENDMNTSYNSFNSTYNKRNNMSDNCNDNIFNFLKKNRSYTRPMNIDDFNMDDEDQTEQDKYNDDDYDDDDNIKKKFKSKKNADLTYNEIFFLIFIYFIKIICMFGKYVIQVILFISFFIYIYFKKKPYKSICTTVLVSFPVLLFCLSFIILSYRSFNTEYFDKDI